MIIKYILLFLPMIACFDHSESKVSYRTETECLSCAVVNKVSCNYSESCRVEVTSRYYTFGDETLTQEIYDTKKDIFIWHITTDVNPVIPGDIICIYVDNFYVNNISNGSMKSVKFKDRKLCGNK